MKGLIIAVAVTGLILLSKAASAEDIESFIVKPEDVTRTNVEFKRDGTATLECMFTEAKASEFTTATERNLNKKLRLVINGKVVSEPVVREKIAGGSFILQVKTADGAVALAKYLMQEIPNKAPETMR